MNDGIQSSEGQPAVEHVTPEVILSSPGADLNNNCFAALQSPANKCWSSSSTDYSPIVCRGGVCVVAVIVLLLEQLLGPLALTVTEPLEAPLRFRNCMTPSLFFSHFLHTHRSRRVVLQS